MGGKPRRSWRALMREHWMRNNETFAAELTSLRTRRTKSTHLRLMRHDPDIAMTVLDCASCGWRIWCEAHHRYGDGKPRPMRHRYTFKSTADYRHYKEWRTKMLRRKTKCPKCGHDAFKYVKTEVYDAKDTYSELAD